MSLERKKKLLSNRKNTLFVIQTFSRKYLFQRSEEDKNIKQYQFTKK